MTISFLIFLRVSDNLENMWFLTPLLLAPFASAFFMQVETGYYAVCKTFGVVNSRTYGPGLYPFVPGVHNCAYENVMAQTDAIKDVSAVTADQQKINWPIVEVTNQCPKSRILDIWKSFASANNGNYDETLIRSPTAQFLREISSTYTAEELRTTIYPSLNELIKKHLEDIQKNRIELNGEDTGILIHRVTVHLPKLSDAVEKEYQRIADEKAKRKAEQQAQATQILQKETQRLIAESEAEQERKVQSIQNQQNIEAEEANQKINKIKVESEAEQIRIRSEAEAAKIRVEAEANKAKHTPEFLQIEALKSYGCQHHHYASQDGKLPPFLINPPAHNIGD